MRPSLMIFLPYFDVFCDLLGTFSSLDGNAKEDVYLKMNKNFLVGISRVTGCAYHLLLRRKLTSA